MWTSTGHHGDVLKVSKMSTKVQEYGSIIEEAVWGTEALVRSPEHLPRVWSSASLLSSNERAKATVLLGLRIPQRMKLSKYSSVLPPTVLVLALHSLCASEYLHSPEDSPRVALGPRTTSPPTPGVRRAHSQHLNL